MIKAVLLDLDDTLVKSDVDRFFPTYLNKLGRHAADLAPPEQFVRQLMASFERTLLENDPTRPLYPRLMEQFAADIGHELVTLTPLFDSFYNDEYSSLRDWIKPRPESPRLLDWLFAHDYQVVVATNPGLPEAAIHHRMRWGEIEPDDYDFDLVTTLETMHFGKPRAEYYTEIVLRLGVDPQEAIMVGDDWEADLVGAAQAGLHTYWVTAERSEPVSGGVALAGRGTYEEFVQKVLDGWLRTLDGSPTTRRRSVLCHRLAAYPAAVDAARRPHSAAVLECCPDDGEWSARDIVCHLRDYEQQSRERLDRVLHEDNPFLSANTNPWAYGEMYRKVSFEDAFAVFAERRAGTVEWLRRLPPGAWQERARDAIFGPTCFEEMVAFITEHDRTHLQQMHRAIDHALVACED